VIVDGAAGGATGACCWAYAPSAKWMANDANATRVARCVADDEVEWGVWTMREFRKGGYKA
jgi:hypothetical protein